jgi:hypothetical protein
MDSDKTLGYLPPVEEKMKVSVEDAQSNGIWCLRLRVRPDHSGIDLLPAPDRKP